MAMKSNYNKGGETERKFKPPVDPRYIVRKRTDEEEKTFGKQYL